MLLPLRANADHTIRFNLAVVWGIVNARYPAD
jgi:hypothetical protein